MGNWKNWLFPILTALTVAALALLPLRLSTLEDGQLTGTVHAEPLTADNNFPSKPPELPGRIWLLVQWQEMPDYLTVMGQELEGADRDREFQLLRAALTGLEDILPPDLIQRLTGLNGNSWNCNRYYLRDQADLSSAGFSLIGTYDKSTGTALAATLDEESGQLVGLQVSGAEDVEFDRSPAETGRALLDRLGLSYEGIDRPAPGELYGSAYFRLRESRTLFGVTQYDHGLFFGFQVDWSAMDGEIAMRYGHEASDAASMQKW